MALSPVLVHNVVVRRTLCRAMARQIRWNKIRYSFSLVTYSAEFLLNPLPLTILGSAPMAVSHPAFAASAVAGVLAARMIQAWTLARIMGATAPARQMLLMPVLDLLQFGAQFVPYVSRSVDWRGHRARLIRGTVMLPVEERPSAAAA